MKKLLSVLALAFLSGCSSVPSDFNDEFVVGRVASVHLCQSEVGEKFGRFMNVTESNDYSPENGNLVDYRVYIPELNRVHSFTVFDTNPQKSNDLVTLKMVGDKLEIVSHGKFNEEKYEQVLKNSK